MVIQKVQNVKQMLQLVNAIFSTLPHAIKFPHQRAWPLWLGHAHLLMQT
jgi:hypothetical protein